LKSGVGCNPVNLRFEEIPHGMDFLQFGDGIGVEVADKHMVIHIHPGFIGWVGRFGFQT